MKRITNGRGADVIYDPVGGEVFDGSMKCIAWNGRLLVIGFAGGVIPEVKANRILLKNISVVGLHWGAYAQHQPERIPEVFAGLAKLYDAGHVRPVIFGTYGLDEVPQALEALAGRGDVRQGDHRALSPESPGAPHEHCSRETPGPHPRQEIDQEYGDCRVSVIRRSGSCDELLAALPTLSRSSRGFVDR